MTDLLQDLRFAIRAFVRAPRFTVPAVIALALGIGATSAIFSVVRGVMLRPLPYRDSDRIISIWETSPSRGQSRGIVAAANFVEWRERNRSFEHLGLVAAARLNLLLDGQPYEVPGMVASSDVFAALGARPAAGRVFAPTEDLEGNDAVMLISYEFWQSRMGGRSDVLGAPINANGRLRTVVGVMPADFTIEGQRAAFFIPYGWTIEGLRATQGRGNSHAIARLRDGVTFAQASDDLTRIAAQLATEAPRRNAGRSVVLVPIQQATVESVRPALLVLSGAVVLVLLIACVNVANLLLARSTIRQRELGLRTALGAGRGRLLRQLLTESLLLSVAGGAAGLALAFAFHRGLLALVAGRIPVPRLDQVALDLPVVAFTIMTALATGLAFGLVPALIASSTANDALRDGGRHGTGRRARRTLSALVVIEVAISLVLLASAGLLLRSFMRLQQVDPGFRAERLLTGRVTLPAARYPQPRDAAAFFDQAIARIRSLPGVQSAAGTSFLPMAGPGIGTSFYRLDRPRPADGQVPSAQVRPVTPQFFRTMGIRQSAGRDFRESDGAESAPVAVISEGVVRQFFPGEDPLAKRLFVNIGPAEGLKVEVVGVVGDVRLAVLDSDTPIAIYIPHAQLSVGQMTFVTRTEMDPASVANSIGAIVRGLDPELPLADVRTMDEVVDATLARPRTVSVLIAAFAAIALVLAGVGVYGVMAYSVSQRTQEIGVRMALGATAESVFRMVMGQALRLVAVGLAGGLIAAGAVTRLLGALLFQTESVDPLTFGATALLLAAVAMVASFVPARRGTRITPVEALRTE